MAFEEGNDIFTPPGLEETLARLNAQDVHRRVKKQRTLAIRAIKNCRDGQFNAHPSIAELQTLVETTDGDKVFAWHGVSVQEYQRWLTQRQ